MQYIYFKGKESDIYKISYEVPQGSILCPLLFILYINEFSGVSEKLFNVLFADDTNIFLNSKNINKLVEII